MTTTTVPPVDAPTRHLTGLRRRALVALALREGSLLVRHPGFRVGVLLTLAAYWLGYIAEQNRARVFGDDSGFFAPFLILCWTVLIVVNLAALRARRDRTSELFDALPTPPVVRTGAHLLSVAAAMPVGAALLLATYLFWGAAPGTVGSVSAGQWAGMLLLLAGAGVSGVIVARWVPTAVAGPITVIVTFVLQVNFGHEDVRWRWLHFAPGDAFSVHFDVRHEGWHAVYLLGLVLLGAVLALLRHRVTLRVAVAGAVAVGLLLISGWAQTRTPGGAQVAARVAELENPAAHQVCEERGAVRLCAYRKFQSWIRLWNEPVQGVLARLPAGVQRGELEVRQRAPLSIALIPQVEARIDPAVVWAADGAVHPGLEWKMQDHHLTLAFQTAAWAVGLPPAVDNGGAACLAGGQARTVVALWLAAQATPDAAASLRERAGKVEREGGHSLVAPSHLDVLPDYAHEDRYPDTGYVPEVGTAGRGADLLAAVSLLDQPADRVSGVLSQHWRRLVDPATPSQVLFELVGAELPVAAALPPVTPGLGSACP